MFFGHFLFQVAGEKMIAYVCIIGAALLVVLLIAMICIIIWKKNSKKSKTKQLDRLPKIANQQYTRQSGVMQPDRSGAASHYEKMADGSDGGVMRPASRNYDGNESDDATIAMSAVEDEHAFLIDRAHKTQLILMKPSIIIGTDENKADFIVRNSRTVSRQHAVIYKKDRSYYVTDNHSTNHTYVNEIILKPGEIRDLHTGDMIRVAEVSLEFMLK